tara:strand:- start:682 stop:1677 length:996 start_codon:yes stop_codon:yes gene_type:complete
MNKSIVYTYFILLFCSLLQTQGLALDIESLLKEKPRNIRFYDFKSNSSIANRIQPTPAFILKQLNSWDNKDYKSYSPSDQQIQLFKNYVKLLPIANQKIIQNKVVGIYFIDEFMGSGLTDWLINDQGEIFTYFIFNSNVFDLNLSQGLTHKENTAFIKNGSENSIEIEAGNNYQLLLYILLHESTHALDYIYRISPYTDKFFEETFGKSNRKLPFIENRWTSLKEPVQGRNFPAQKKVSFYALNDGPHLALSNIEMTYNGLQQSGFISLYGSLNWAEDLAETLSFYHLTQILEQPYIIKINEKRLSLSSEDYYKKHDFPKSLFYSDALFLK